MQKYFHCAPESASWVSSPLQGSFYFPATKAPEKVRVRWQWCKLHVPESCQSGVTTSPRWGSQLNNECNSLTRENLVSSLANLLWPPLGPQSHASSHWVPADKADPSVNRNRVTAVSKNCLSWKINVLIPSKGKPIRVDTWEKLDRTHFISYLTKVNVE